MEHLYWIVMLDNIKNLTEGLIVAGVIGTVIAVITVVNLGIYENKFFKISFIIPSITLFCLVVGVLGATFIPSTKQMIAIITIPKIINNEQVQDLPDNALKLINQKLKEWAQDTEIIPKEQPK